jgi:hypothetical protein
MAKKKKKKQQKGNIPSVVIDSLRNYTSGGPMMDRRKKRGKERENYFEGWLK